MNVRGLVRLVLWSVAFLLPLLLLFLLILPNTDCKVVGVLLRFLFPYR